MEKYYAKLFHSILQNMKSVLYVGYEDEDYLLPLIVKNQVSILAIDREIRKNIPYYNVKYRQMDFLDIASEPGNKYDVIIFSFVLHENMSEIHCDMIKLAEKISRVLIVIEPLPRIDMYGLKFDKLVAELFAKQNKIKCYYDEMYWENLVEFNEKKDSKIIFKRTKLKESLCLKDDIGKLFSIGMQDIIILICDNEKEAES